MNLRVGDAVILKSGSPEMTVVKIEGANLVCSYFLEGEERSYTAPHDALKLVRRINRQAN